MVTTVHVGDAELSLWLENFPNRSELMRQALREFKARHYDGVYFNKQEALDDKEKYEKQLKEAKDKLEKINKLLTKKVDDDVKEET